ncbi:AbrB/MazE/SpoVT family DNA-binding domain-containing protein [Methyloprofundus sp.]|uniref:AbrB/MazE/SpoVT family DNA-binding domain-containing protein n=1 Tax=Methyloprofundus sp. TaxID=2020875 RepID=UPI003D0C71CD
MPMVKIRPKGQITIPSEILHAWKIHTEDKVNVNLINGIVTLTPVKRLENKKSILSYAGIAKGMWGKTAEDIDHFITNERESWEK